MTQHVLEGPRFPSVWPKTVPPGIEYVLGKALMREPGGRFPNASAFASAIEELNKIPGQQEKHQTTPTGVPLHQNRIQTTQAAVPHPLKEGYVHPICFAGCCFDPYMSGSLQCRFYCSCLSGSRLRKVRKSSKSYPTARRIYNTEIPTRIVATRTAVLTIPPQP